MPEHDQRQASFEGMLEYGKSAVRSLFLVNGGAIVTLFALISSVLEHGSKEAVIALVPGMWCFVVGLAFAIVPSFLGYVNFACWYESQPAAPGTPFLKWTGRLALASATLSLLSFGIGFWFVSGALQLL